MKTVKAGILSLLISISNWLHDGLKSYEAKKYDDAITNFTKVIEKDVPENRSRDIAIYYRAKSYEAKKEKKKALADLLVLMQKHPDSYLLKDSTALYKKMGGDMKKILPADSPKKVWEKFVAAAEKGDAETAMKISTGIWQKMVKERGDRFGEQFSKMEIKVGDEKIGKGEEKGTATLDLLNLGQKQTLKMNFVLDSKSNTWLIKGFAGMEEAKGKALSISNMNNLKQIGLGLRMYSMDHEENFPPNFDSLKTEGYLENETVYLWTNPSKPLEKFPFIYCPGYNEADSVDTMVAASPKAVNGKREVLWLDGHVKTISEKEFIKNAKKQKWRLKGVVKKEEVPEKIKKKVLELIAKLADKNFKVRKMAKEELKKLDDSAYPFLEENRNHKDPEVKMTIKDILEGK